MSSKQSPYQITLQINLTPWDLPHACLVLPHQLQFWSASCSESLLLWDLDPGPKIQTASGPEQWQRCLELLPAFQAALQADWPGLVQKTCDLRGTKAESARQALGRRYFVPPEFQSTQPPAMPHKDFRGGPFAAYFMGLEMAQNDLVLHLDGDMLFGGAASAWISAAITLLENHPDCLCVAPPGGPPAPMLANMIAHLIAHTPAAKFSAYAGIEFWQKQEIFTSRCFLIRRSELYQALLLAYRMPERAGDPGWCEPYAELVEVILTRFMQSQGRYRLDYSPAEEPIWSLHPPTQFEARYLKLLPAIIAQMQNPNWPSAQIGEYDLLPCSLDWLAAK